MSDLDESAKAVQESAKFGRALLKSIKDVERIGKQLLGPFGEGYGILTDIVRHSREELNWRFENRKQIYRKATLLAARRGLKLENLKTIPKRVAYDYEDGLEKEDNELLRQLWANLLVNVASPNSDVEPKKIYQDILGKLDFDQALFLNELGIRAKFVSFYFSICPIVDSKSGKVIGTQVQPALLPFVDSEAIPSTKLFKLLNDQTFHVSWSEEKIFATVDILSAVGLVYWTTELYMAEEMLDADENIQPSSSFVEIGQRVLQNSRGVRAFKISQLGSDFIAAVSPEPAFLHSKRRRGRKS